MVKTATEDSSRKRKPPRMSIDTYIAQCWKCYKWRYIETQEKYEEIRSQTPKKCFECKSCEEVGDVDVNCDFPWFLDQHGIPKTPQGWKRILVIRESGNKADVYYVTPQEKRLRSLKEVAKFIQDNEQFKDTKIEEFSFATPKRMKKTKSKDVAVAVNKN